MSEDQLIKKKYEMMFIQLFDVMTFDLFRAIKKMESEELDKLKSTA